jgi:hypothetical protein
MKKSLIENHLNFLNNLFLKSDSLDSALTEGNLLYVLSEGELDQPDVEALRDQVDQLELSIKNILSSSDIEKIPSAKSWFEDQLGNINVVKELVVRLDLNQKPKGLKAFLKKAFGKQVTPKEALSTVGLIDSISLAAIASLKSTFTLLKRNIDGMSNLKTSLGGKPLRDITPDSGITLGDIEAGIEKAFASAKRDSLTLSSRKIAKKLSSFAASLPGVILNNFPDEAVKAEILSLNLPEFESLVSSLSGTAAPDLQYSSLEDIVSSEEEKQAGVSIPKNKIGKAAKAWLKKLEDDGSDETILKLGKVWITAVSNDSEFQKLVGLEEAKKHISFNLLLEQIKWPDLISIFKKNAPGFLKNLSDEEMEPLISPFAAALSDEGVEIQDSSGKTIKIKDSSSEKLIDDIEEKSAENQDSGKESTPDSKTNKTKNVLNQVSSFLKDPESAIKKIMQAFEFEIKENKKFSLFRLLNEKSIKYSEVELVLQDHLPENPIEKLDAIKAIKDAVQQNLGSEFDIIDFPKKEDLDANQEIDIEDPSQLSDKEESNQDQIADKLSGALGKTPIDKNKLAAILKSYPDITGTGSKATKARRNLRKAINNAAGMEVFAENFDYNQKQEKYLIKDSKDYSPIGRWKKLAGIDDD